MVVIVGHLNSSFVCPQIINVVAGYMCFCYRSRDEQSMCSSTYFVRNDGMCFGSTFKSATKIISLVQVLESFLVALDC